MCTLVLLHKSGITLMDERVDFCHLLCHRDEEAAPPILSTCQKRPAASESEASAMEDTQTAAAGEASSTTGKRKRKRRKKKMKEATGE